MLTSSGIAANNEETWELLKTKHPYVPIPSPPINIPPQSSVDLLPSDFNISAVLLSFPKDTSCGPSGLRVQHLLDASEASLPSSLLSALKAVINKLASGRALPEIAEYLAGATVIALKKPVGNDIRPIAVGEVLRRLTSKCLCAIVKSKASEFFNPYQYGVVCPSGVEKIIHSLRSSIDDHWFDEDFNVAKVDLRNAFNLVSRNAVLENCAEFFPEIFPWTLWCYGVHPKLWHPMGMLRSATGVQQGDPLGPLLFSLVLHGLILKIAEDDMCGELLFNKWYLDDGVLAGTSLSVRAALDVISSLGPSLGLYINFAKCEVFGKAELSAFPSEITKRYHTPQLEILGAPIGNEEFCNNFVINKQSSVSFLLQQLQGLENPQLALALLRKCAAFCKMTHISRVTPPTLIKSSLSEFDDSIHHCFTECLALNLSPQSSGWKQACLSLSRGGLGLRSVAVHSTAAYLGSVSSSSPDLASSHYVIDALNLFNLQVSAEDTVSIPLPTKSHFQHDLSQRIENCQFHALYNSGSLANRARLLSISSAHASSWLQVVPSPRQGCDMATSEMQWGIKWWLGLPLTPELGVCAYCPDKALDAHHAVTCKFGGDVVARHNALRNAIFDFCKRALLNPKLEAGAGLGHERRLTRPADILIPSWSNGDKPAAIDVSITSPLKSNILSEAGVVAGAAARQTEERKHTCNDTICSELGWKCVPLVVETFGAWGRTAGQFFGELASRLAAQSHSSKTTMLNNIYGRLSLILVRANARAFNARLATTMDLLEG
eukprot:Em0006g820a